MALGAAVGCCWILGLQVNILTGTTEAEQQCLKTRRQLTVDEANYLEILRFPANAPVAVSSKK